MNRLITDLGELDALFDHYAERFGRDQTGYRNHVYRVINLVNTLHPLAGDDLRKLQIAGFFHDAGVWLAGTLDYLGPSVRLACYYLEQQQRQDWSEEIRQMIINHHKLTATGPSPNTLTEAFRRASWIDLTLGLLRFDVAPERLREIDHRFPNAGFHAMLAGRVLRHIATRPWRPLPMLKF